MSNTELLDIGDQVYNVALSYIYDGNITGSGLCVRFSSWYDIVPRVSGGKMGLNSHLRQGV